MESPPSTSLTSFNCPHCRALAQQFWWDVYARQTSDNKPPSVVREGDDLEQLIKLVRKDSVLNDDKKNEFERLFRLKATGAVFLGSQDSNYVRLAHNVWFSSCYHCNKVSVWLYDRLVWPAQHGAPIANSDLPDDVRADYDEAGVIVNLSPRGAAALLRLAIQKLMPNLKQRGKDLNEDIGNLVAAGLDVRIQRSLDIVRVIGNNAVHPGQIDLTDDQATAQELFHLVNAIAEAMISQPKKIETLYGRLPSTARTAIEARDNKKP
jgi:hypothetical protein